MSRGDDAERATPASRRIVTACVLIIGNEILSGRTQDANLAFLAQGLNEAGIRLREARVIPDDPGDDRRHGQRGAARVRLRLHDRRHRPDP